MLTQFLSTLQAPYADSMKLKNFVEPKKILDTFIKNIGFHMSPYRV